MRCEYTADRSDPKRLSVLVMNLRSLLLRVAFLRKESRCCFQDRDRSSSSAFLYLEAWIFSASLVVIPSPLLTRAGTGEYS